MLKTYQSNRLDVLKELMGFIIQNEMLDTPISPEIILVPNTSTAQWLQISLAEKLGISGNIKFPAIENFIWDMFVRVLSDIPEQSFLSKQDLTWKLMALLPKILQEKKCTILRFYLNDGGNKQELFQFSLRMAELYDQYSIYRPNWLISWEEGKQVTELPEEQIWQAFLWKSLVEYTVQLNQPHWHRANLYECFINILQNTSKPIYKLPTRIFIFGISTLPPVYLGIFEALSKYIDIHILFINPCRHYWGDAKSSNLLEVLLAKQHSCLVLNRNKTLPTKEMTSSTRLFDWDGIQNLPNPLLASWGKLGCDYIHMLLDITESNGGRIDAFSKAIPGCLLHNLQEDILELKNNSLGFNPVKKFQRTENNRHCLNPEDRSVTIHVCHSVQREVEVLHDNLLDMLNSDPDLHLRDIIVMVSDIDKYAPFVQGVFDSATDNRFIPYKISGYRIRKLHSILDAFISLLSLPDNRFLSEDVLALLDIPMLAARFNIDEEGVTYIRQWVKESGIRWGIDDDNVQEFSLPVTGQHTWKFGLTRMLLGYAMDSTQGEWNEVLPYDGSSNDGMISELIGHLASFLMYLNHWKKELAYEKKLETWLPICRSILHDFFLPHKKIEEEIEIIEQQWHLIIEEGIRACFDEPIPLSLLRNEIISRFAKKQRTRCFIDGSLNICSLRAIRSVPFKVVCLIGMNDGIYPKPLAQFDFDLMSRKPQIGDCNRRYEDRYIFLETLISVQKILYISYIGFSIQNNTKRFPSVLVQETMDYIAQSHYLIGDDFRDYDDSEKRVKSHITFLHSRMPFDPVNYFEKSRQSYAREWLPAAREAGVPHGDFIQELDDFPVDTLDFEKLQSFWMHPVRAFFQIRLGINLQSEENEVPDAEPFTLDNLKRYRLNKHLLQAILVEEDEKALFHRYRASGELPYGAFGEIAWDTQCKEMQALANNIMKYRKETINHEINLKCSGVQLVGWLHHVQSDGILRWHSGLLTVAQGMKLWLEHLVYCANGGNGESRLFARENKNWHFLSLTKKEAFHYLSQLIKGYKNGMQKPLLLLPESSGAWIKTCYSAKDNNMSLDETILRKARNKFFQIYRGNMMTLGEKDDIWYQKLRLSPELENFETIIQEAKRYLLPLYQYNYSQSLL